MQHKGTNSQTENLTCRWTTVDMLPPHRSKTGNSWPRVHRAMAVIDKHAISRPQNESTLPS
jgi:hypothetical protein